MMYLDPKSDTAFKKLFGDITHKNIVISFLNSVLERAEGELIVDVVINDPANFPETIYAKSSIVDVRCTDQAGNQYIIEMQVMVQDYYAIRAQYYAALGLSRQIAAGGRYKTLVPVIFVGVLNFNLFEGENYVSHHLTLNQETYRCELKHSKFAFIELKKFKKELNEIDTILDKWIYFLKHADSLDAVPSELQSPVLQEAFDVLERGHWTTPELEAYERYLDGIRSTADQLEAADRIGMEKGMERGMEKGKMEGKMEEKIMIAKNLLGVLALADIARITGLSIEFIEELKDK